MIAKLRNRQSSDTESTSQALSKSATRGTVMLITVSVTFIVLTGPSAFSNAIGGQKPHPIVQVVMNAMQYLNHSINGILYCVVGSIFRREVMKILCYGRNTIPNTLNSRTSNLSLSTVSNHSTQLTTSQTDFPM